MVVAAGSRWNSYSYTVTKDCFVSSGGLVHDLEVTFDTHPDDDDVERVRDASATLVCRIDKPYARVLSDSLYAKGSIGYAFLSSHDARDAARHYPTLVGVTFTYVHTVNGFISRWGPTVHSGIEATASFEVDGGPEKRGGRNIRRGAPSGLDPERTWAGRNVEFLLSPRETLGGFEASGASGGSWGWRPDDDR